MRGELTIEQRGEMSIAKLANAAGSARTTTVPPDEPALSRLWVPITSSTSCDQPIFVDQITDLSVSSDAVLVEVDRLG